MEINKILNNDLTDERIIKELGGEFIYKIHKPENEKTKCYIEYMIIRNENIDYCGNSNLFINNLIQIDVFALTGIKASKIMKIIKNVLSEKDYNYAYGYEDYEKDTNLYTEKIRVYKKIRKGE